MSNVYKLDGDDAAQAWNALLQDINDLVPECPGVDPLELLTDPALWSKQDIKEAQDKLLELCENNSFDPIKDLWEKEKVDELIAAIAAGTCCCEEEDKVFDNLTDFTFFTFFDEDDNCVGVDWSGWIMQEIDPLVIEEIECPVAEGEEPITIERRSGGRGWVGREFSSWEMHYNGVIIRSGTVTAGYIDGVGEGTWRAEETCEDPEPTGGTPLGETDPAWGFPYDIEFSGGTFTINHLVSGTIASFSNCPDLDGHVNPSFVTSPWIEFDVAASVPPVSFKPGTSPFLRLKCE